MITLRFYVASITETANGSHSLRMQPDYADGTNTDWSKYTPAGHIELNLSKDAAVDFYREAMRNKSTVEIEMRVE